MEGGPLKVDVVDNILNFVVVVVGGNAVPRGTGGGSTP